MGYLSERFYQRNNKKPPDAVWGQSFHIEFNGKTAGLSKLGRRNHLYLRRGWGYYPDDFTHEQSLVFRTHDGLIIFNSCSHSGADVVMEEVGKAFPEESVKAYLGGLHLFRMNESEVGEIADKIRKAGINRVITGHCTGDKAYAILRSQLGGGNNRTVPLQRFSPRRNGSNWCQRNLNRCRQLIKSGEMTQDGLVVIPQELL